MGAGESRTRYGAVRLFRDGDAEITSAIADGMMAARQAQMEHDAMLRARVERSLMRVDIGRGGWSKSDYDALIHSAQLTHGTVYRRETVARRLVHRLLGVYGLLVLCCRESFSMTGERWTGR